MEKGEMQCPFCGGHMETGKLSITGGRGPGNLWWTADKKVPHENPLRLFGKTFFAKKTVVFHLLSNNSLFTNDDAPSEALGWYCPKCKKAFATFDVFPWL